MLFKQKSKIILQEFYFGGQVCFFGGGQSALGRDELFVGGGQSELGFTKFLDDLHGLARTVPEKLLAHFGMVFPVGFSAFHIVWRMPVDNFGNGFDRDGRVLQRMIRQMQVSLFHGVFGGKQNGAVV